VRIILADSGILANYRLAKTVELVDGMQGFANRLRRHVGLTRGLVFAGQLLLGLAALAVLGFLLWLVRGYLPDVAAGMQLRAHHAAEVWFDGTPWQVAEVGLVTTQLGHAGEFCRLQNRVVLEARLRGAPAGMEEVVSR